MNSIHGPPGTEWLKFSYSIICTVWFCPHILFPAVPTRYDSFQMFIIWMHILYSKEYFRWKNASLMYTLIKLFFRSYLFIKRLLSKPSSDPACNCLETPRPFSNDYQTFFSNPVVMAIVNAPTNPTRPLSNKFQLTE